MAEFKFRPGIATEVSAGIPTDDIPSGDFQERVRAARREAFATGRSVQIEVHEAKGVWPYGDENSDVFVRTVGEDSRLLSSRHRLPEGLQLGVSLNGLSTSEQSDIIASALGFNPEAARRLPGTNHTLGDQVEFLGQPRDAHLQTASRRTSALASSRNVR